ncbi:minor coat protein [Citrus associated ampelovirus 2]|nr:minor coat protein [Citrus associated ampelovirus 2]
MSEYKTRRNFPKYDASERTILSTYRKIFSNQPLTDEERSNDDYFEEGNYLVRTEYLGRFNSQVGVSVKCKENLRNYDLGFRLILPKSNRVSGIVVSLDKRKGGSTFNFKVGTYINEEVTYFNASTGTSPMGGTVISIRGGMSAYFCYVDLNDYLKHTFSTTESGARECYLFAFIKLSEQELYDMYNKDEGTQLFDSIKLDYRGERWPISSNRIMITEPTKRILNFKKLILPEEERVVVPPAVEPVRGREEIKPEASESREGSREEVLPPDGDFQGYDTPNIEDVAKDVKNLSELVSNTTFDYKIQYSNISDVNVPWIVPPGVMKPDDCKLVFENLKKTIPDIFGGYSQIYENLLIVGLIQGSLTFTTVEAEDDSNNKQIVTVIYKDVKYEMDFKALKRIIRSSVLGKYYANPLRQFMKWFSTTTIAMIKSGIVTPNYYLLARHGVVHKFIPYCFDYCVLDARFNNKHQKLSSAMARATAINLRNRTRKHDSEVYNVSEL